MLLAAAFIAAPLAALSVPAAHAADAPPDLAALQAMEPASGPEMPFAAEKRAEAVRLAALGFGSRAGLARRGWEIGAMLDRHRRAARGDRRRLPRAGDGRYAPSSRPRQPGRRSQLSPCVPSASCSLPSLAARSRMHSGTRCACLGGWEGRGRGGCARIGRRSPRGPWSCSC